MDVGRLSAGLMLKDFMRSLDLNNHPHSFEAEMQLKMEGESKICVCNLNAGYSAGWCEESYGIKLDAEEIEVRILALNNLENNGIIVFPKVITGMAIVAALTL